MSAITKSITQAIEYAEQRVADTHGKHKLYYRTTRDEYIVASPGSDKPDNSLYKGYWFWNGERVEWSSNVSNESP